MKFLIDAHLPYSLCALCAERGHDAIHTLDLPLKNATSDEAINKISLAEQRVVISKDSDFFYSHVLQQRPWKLLLVRTGNISTRDLIALFRHNFPLIETSLEEHALLEIDRVTVTPAAWVPE